MADVPWGLVAILAASGVPMALLSSLVGMRPRVENPLWWGIYVIWVAVVLYLDVAVVFRTILIASVLAGLVHAITVSLLLDRYMASNPWHVDKMQGPRGRLRLQFIAMGLVIGAVFGAIVGGIAWWISQ